LLPNPKHDPAPPGRRPLHATPKPTPIQAHAGALIEPYALTESECPTAKGPKATPEAKNRLPPQGTFGLGSQPPGRT
jgi:hypothetical protein